MLGGENNSSCGSGGVSMSRVRTWIEGQTKGIDKNKGATGMLPKNHPGAPEAESSVRSAVKLDYKVTLVIGRVPNVEGSICREGLERM